MRSKLQKCIQKYKQAHIVFDVYMTDSMKTETRKNRGMGVRLKVVSTAKTPSQWASFLRNYQNKTKLFAFLADKIAASQANDQTCIIVRKGDSAVCSIPDLQSCTHEETDTRVFMHAAYATKHENVSDAIICSSDTNVVVIAVSSMEQTGLDKLWIEFGREKYLRWNPIHEIVVAMGPKASPLPFFHAFSGCDSVCLSWQGKETCMANMDYLPACRSHLHQVKLNTNSFRR